MSNLDNIFPTSLHIILYIVLAIAIVIAVYIILGKVLSSLRIRGVIGRRVEETGKMAVLIISIIIVVPMLLSSVFEVAEARWIAIAILFMVIFIGIYSFRNYLENFVSYLFVVLSGIIDDGDNIRIEIGGKSYEGTAIIGEGEYMILKTDHGSYIYVPYSAILKSIIIKTIQSHIVAKLYVRGQGIDVEKLVNDVSSIIRKSSKYIEKSSVSVKPVEANEEGVTLLLDVDIVNPRKIDECYEEMVKIIMRELPYRVSIEIIR